MNKRLHVLVVIVVAFLALGAGSGGGGKMLEVDDAAPDFSSKTLDEKQFILSSAYEEKPVVLVFIRGFG